MSACITYPEKENFNVQKLFFLCYIYLLFLKKKKIHFFKNLLEKALPNM